MLLQFLFLLQLRKQTGECEVHSLVRDMGFPVWLLSASCVYLRQPESHQQHIKSKQGKISCWAVGKPIDFEELVLWLNNEPWILQPGTCHQYYINEKEKPLELLWRHKSWGYRVVNQEAFMNRYCGVLQ